MHNKRRDWTRYFLEAQGYGVRKFIVYQDNESTILLAEMERRPVGAVPNN
jgi:hypothetical protein